MGLHKQSGTKHDISNLFSDGSANICVCAFVFMSVHLCASVHMCVESTWGKVLTQGASEKLKMDAHYHSPSLSVYA